QPYVRIEHLIHVGGGHGEMQFLAPANMALETHINMETRLKRKLRGPLPGGDRRGTPGADAGCLSMRSVSGVELSRRTPTRSVSGLDITADDEDRPTDSTINSPVEPYSPSTVSYTPSVRSSPTTSIDDPIPTSDAAREVNSFLPASTKAGKPRMRMKWSNDVNIFIMRTYYYITKLETDFTTYRKRLHEYFTRSYPEVNVNEQRVSDQRRTIIRNKLLSQKVLNKLKEDIRIKLLDEEQQTIHNNSMVNQEDEVNTQMQSHTQYHTHTEHPITQSQASTLHSQTTNTSTQTEFITLLLENDVETLVGTRPEITESTQQLCDKFRTTLMLYSGMDPASRPRLPKLKYNSKVVKLIQLFNNIILNDFIFDDTKLIDLHTIIYCTAVVISEELGYQIQSDNTTVGHKEKSKAAWQIRLERNIEKLRVDIGRLTQYVKGNRSRKVTKRVEAIFKNTTTHTRHENDNKRPEEYLDTLKQKLALKVHRLKRYKKAQQRLIDNKLFSTNEKTFYRQLLKKQTPNTSEHTSDIDTIELPTEKQLEEFWAGIWEKEENHNGEACWITQEKERFKDIEEMSFSEVTADEITIITKKLHNWKSPGIDKIYNYWYKMLTSL
ncbi:hypothetical protein O3G_MSEX000525, partial [Manduca sexta]